MPLNKTGKFNYAISRKNAESMKDAKKTSKEKHEEANNDGHWLKKEIGLLSAVGIIVGTMIGSGIFISPKIVLRRTGSVGASLIIWAVCGILNMIVALCYLELGTMIRVSGGDYAYLMEAFGQSKKHKFLGPLPAYLYSWINIVVSRPGSIAIMTMTFARYAVNPFFGECGAPVFLTKLCAICAVMVIATVNCYNVKVATRLQNFYMFAKLSALVIIIIGGIVNLIKGYTGNLQYGMEGATLSPSEIALAMYGGNWAYAGWHNLNMVVEEVKNPNKTVPRAMLIAVPLVTVIYIMTNISYFTVMTKEELLASPAVAMTWGNAMLGVMAWIIPASVAFSTFGCCACSFFSTGRLCHAAARDGHHLSLLSYISINRLTPSPALTFFATIAIVMIIPSDIQSLLTFVSFMSWFSRGFCMLTLILMRWTRANLERPIKVPIALPVISLLFSIFLVAAPIIEDPKLGYLYAALVYLSGVLSYIPFVYYKRHPNFLGKLTIWCQMFFEVAPSDIDDIAF